MNNLTRIIRYNKPNPKIIPKITAIMLNTIICVWLIFSFPLSVYASEHGGGGSTSDSITTWTDSQKADYFKTNFVKMLGRVAGAVVGGNSVDDIFNSFRNIYYTDTIQQNMTWEQWLAQDLGWTFDDKGEPTITLSVDCQNAMQQAVDKWIDTQGYYFAYTFDINQLYSIISDKSQYDNIVNLCKANDFVGVYTGNRCNYRLLNDIYFVNNIYGITPPQNYCCLSVFNSQWQSVECPLYKLDGSLINEKNSDSVFLSLDLEHDYYTNNSYHQFIFSNGRKRVKVFSSLDSFKAESVGAQTYYITNDYSKGATYNTTKTIDNSTIQNTISYDSVQNFNQQYYDEHNTTANYETINNYITNYYETINNNGGSGGGGGSGDSGGGIFDWLGSVGEILGSLIKALGEIVVGLLDGIATVITSFIDTLPTQVNNLFGTLFDWLPPEIRSLIVLSITLSLIWGIIKLIRG